MTSLSRRNSRAYSSILSDDSHPTPRPTPPPPTRRSGTRGVRATSITPDAPQPAETAQTTKIAPHYFLPPTVPSPFTGTLEASLDAVLAWGQAHPATEPVVTALCEPVSTSTNWSAILSAAFGDASALAPKVRRSLLEEFIILVTRTLLPEQIAENRAAMARLYDRKKQLAIRLVLRYDMIREWCLGDGPVGKRDLSVASVPPTSNGVQTPAASPMKDTGDYERRPLMPNVWPTLIAAPPGGFMTHGVRERMKHYVTPLDNYLLLTDEEVKGWSATTLVIRASQIVLQWQWLRQKNETLEKMERDGWEELDGRADDCEWIAERTEGNWRGGKGGEEGA